MKKLSLFQLINSSRVIVDSYMESNDYFIYSVKSGKTPDIKIVVYKLQSCIIQYIECSFINNQLFNIYFTTVEN